MFKNLLQFYALLSCLGYGIIFFISTGEFIQSSIFYTFPQFSQRVKPERFETNEAFVEHEIGRKKQSHWQGKPEEIKEQENRQAGLDVEKTKQRYQQMSQADLTRLREQAAQTWERREIEDIQKSHLNKAVKEIPWMLLSLLLLILHVWVYKRSKP